MISSAFVRRWVFSGLLVLTLGGCRTLPTEPLNLTEAKAAVVAYHASGDYDRAIAAVAESASAWIERRVARKIEGERLAVVFDIDETVLSNFPHMRSRDFGYHPEAWSEWVRSAEGPALVPMRRTCERARELGVAVIFITGRPAERDEPGTVANLRAQGMGDYERVVLKPATARARTAEEWKTSVRRELEASGWVIIASIGDQWSDLRGGHAERVFKAPNPFYRID